MSARSRLVLAVGLGALIPPLAHLAVETAHRFGLFDRLIGDAP